MAKSAISTKARIQIILRVVLTPIVIALLLFFMAGRWDYWQGWVYFGLIIMIELVMTTIMARNKELIEERLNPKEGMKTWDKVYFGITTPLYIIAIILGGLDARFGWTRDLPLALYWTGVIVYLIGEAIFLWARDTNNYFSSVVRIQADRGQTVCKEGLYRIVRHPGYVGGFLFTVTVGLILGSWWACIPQVIAALMLIWRTALEDKTLQAELSGYAEYAKGTRYRLIPGIW